MSIKIGSNTPSRFFVGNQEIQKLMMGNNLVWENYQHTTLWTGSDTSAEGFNLANLSGYILIKLRVSGKVVYYQNTVSFALSQPTVSFHLISNISSQAQPAKLFYFDMTANSIGINHTYQSVDVDTLITGIYQAQDLPTIAF